jgi:hypothetical protein
MGFKAARVELLAALAQGNVQFPYRAGGLEAKNHLAVGKITIAEVIEMLMACRGTEHSESPLHEDATISVHVFKPVYEGRRWYIKAYLIETVGYFISVHPAG